MASIREKLVQHLVTADLEHGAFLPNSEIGVEEETPLQIAENRKSLRTRITAGALLLCCAILVLVFACLRSTPSPGFRVAEDRTGFHFQPEKKWMNDPNGPMYYSGYYHVFYQYNPFAAVWGNIAWGHAVSTNLVHWSFLDLALVPDKWYDSNGVWSGSATILEDGSPVLLYTGSSSEDEQLQCLAFPANASDPLLREWVKDAQNPIIAHPNGIDGKDFRDPTTAWRGVDGLWRISVGSKNGTTGLALVYKSSDFRTWEVQEQILHSVPETGMWECVDFYPVSGKRGLDTSANGLAPKSVLKVSLDDEKHDYYALGSYSLEQGVFSPDNPLLDASIGLRYDYGKFYASKSFFDPLKNRRILWGWANESDSEEMDIAKGWASVMVIPRTVLLDEATGTNLLQWPIEEIESLRRQPAKIESMTLPAGAVVEVVGATGSQLDIEAQFSFPNVNDIDALEESFDCAQGGAAQRGLFGPFGLLVLADVQLVEQTGVFFYLVSRGSGQWDTVVCSDQSRSSLATGIDKTVYGTDVKVLPTENTLSLRVIVDHSIVESFAQGGRTCITSRIYPTLATGSSSRVFLFNNGTSPIQVQSVVAWHMENASMQYR